MQLDVLTPETTQPAELASSAPAEDAPFFEGFVGSPLPVAQALLVLADVAGRRFFTPMTSTIKQMILDPVVTATENELRFESFSLCCGVYARLDVSDFEAETHTSGVTNIDVNQKLRRLLAKVGTRLPLKLKVSAAGLTAHTLDGEETEEKVPLPPRWVRGFAESQMLSSTLVQKLELTGQNMRSFIARVPKTTRYNTVMWVHPVGGAMARLGSQKATGAVCLAGPERLRVLDPLLPFASSLRAFGSAVIEKGSAPEASAWVLEMDGARFTLVLSPEKARGFSGEGSLLNQLTDQTLVDDADLLLMSLSFDGFLEVDRLARETGLSTDRVQAALQVLACSGQVGFDIEVGQYFFRPLPFDEKAMAVLNPRLVNAQSLLEKNAVSLVAENHFAVQSGEVSYDVKISEEQTTCTCLWYGKYKGRRGPCKHVLAVTIFRQEQSHD